MGVPQISSPFLTRRAGPQEVETPSCEPVGEGDGLTTIHERQIDDFLSFSLPRPLRPYPVGGQHCWCCREEECLGSRRRRRLRYGNYIPRSTGSGLGFTGLRLQYRLSLFSNFTFGCENDLFRFLASFREFGPLISHKISILKRYSE